MILARHLLLLLLATPICAGEISVVETRIEMGEQGMIRACELQTPGGAFVLVPPTGWRTIINDRDRSASFLMPEGFAAIRLCVAGVPRRAGSAKDVDTFWRAHAAKLFKGSRVTDTFMANAVGRTGHGYELAMTAANSKWVGLVALVPRDNDVLEISLSTSRDHLEATRREFLHLLHSLSLRTVALSGATPAVSVQIRTSVQN